jgi:glycosyl transferase family 25
MSQFHDMNLLDYFDRISIIHLKERADRYRELARELRRLGIEITHGKVCIPDAPMPSEASGFPDKGTYGNFLSHLEILKSAQRDGLQSVWVLEDDAIFSHRFVREQHKIAEFLSRSQWDICFFGHTLTKQLDALEVGLPRFHGPFLWAHCYAVHGRILPRLIAYLEETRHRTSRHPHEDRMYIDHAYNLFRKFNPDVITLVGNPVLSVQSSSQSSLGDLRWYKRHPLARPVVKLTFAIRDEFWRWTDLFFTFRSGRSGR